MASRDNILEFDPSTYEFKGCLKITTSDLSGIQTTFREFIDNEVQWNGIEFQVWLWTRPRKLYLYKKQELLGMYLGMAWKLGIIDGSESLECYLVLALDIINLYNSCPYHNAGHGWDVAFMVYYMLLDLGVADQLSLTKSELAALFIGALGHDIGHPGVNNIYQINAKTEIAQKYNNKSVLENYSIDLLYDILDRNSFLDTIFVNDTEKKNQFRDLIKVIILNTDMVYHIDMVNRLATLVESQPSTHITEAIDEENVGEEKYSEKYDSVSSISSHMPSHLEQIIRESLESRNLLISCILHAADISNPARPFFVSKIWSGMVIEEFFLQGDKEKENNLPISPSMDRENTNGGDVAAGFTNSIVQPFFDLLSIIFPRMDCFYLLLRDNVRRTEKPLLHSPARKVSMAAGMIEINCDLLSSMSGRIRLMKRSDNHLNDSSAATRRSTNEIIKE